MSEASGADAFFGGLRDGEQLRKVEAAQASEANFEATCVKRVIALIHKSPEVKKPRLNKSVKALASELADLTGSATDSLLTFNLFDKAYNFPIRFSTRRGKARDHNKAIVKDVKGWKKWKAEEDFKSPDPLSRGDFQVGRMTVGLNEIAAHGVHELNVRDLLGNFKKTFAYLDWCRGRDECSVGRSFGLVISHINVPFVLHDWAQSLAFNGTRIVHRRENEVIIVERLDDLVTCVLENWSPR